MLPVAVVGLWLWGLVSVVVLGAGGYLVYDWWYDWWNGWHSERWPLLLGAFLLLLSALGRPLILPLLGRSPRPGEIEPQILREGRMHRLERPDGTALLLEELGPALAPTLVLTHGWGLNGAAWFYARHWLSPHFRLLLWDLPGLGGSRASRDQNFELPKLAADLAAVVEFAASPVVLVGHSIGGMIMLTFAREFPELLRRQVRGMVLTHTTPHNPVITARYGPVWRALQAPLLRPLCYLTIGLSPLVRVMNALSYANGVTQLQIHLGQFGGQETRGQLTYVSRLGLMANPAVCARGMLAMTRYDAADVLPSMPVPSLVIAADRDQATVPAASHLMARRLPGAAEVTLMQSGHLGLIEHHEQWARAVRAFADQCFGGLVPARPLISDER